MSDAIHVDKTTKIKTELTELRDEKKVIRKHQEQIEREHEEVLKGGQENEKKGREETAKQVVAEQKEKQTYDDEWKNRLELNIHRHESYKETLAKALANQLMQLDWPKFWTADCLVTKQGQGISIKGKHFVAQDGVLLVVTAPNGAVYHQGIHITNEPILDYAAIITMAVQTENTLDKARNLLLSGGHDGDEGAILGPNGRRIERSAPSGIS